MAGRGAPPKDPSRRARRNADPIPLRIIHADPVTQPELPTMHIEKDGKFVEYQWPVVTQEWWQLWGDEPISDQFRATDWAFLADTAILHARLWGLGDSSVASELRLRVAKLGATLEDRARLRIVFASADEAEVTAHEAKNGAGKRQSATRKGWTGAS